MPELPEAETITRALDRVLKKRKIKKVEVFTPKLRTPLGPLCMAKLEGREFTGCRRRARYAVADLDDGRMLVFHFGMTGTVRVDPREVQRRKHDHAVLTLDDGTELRCGGTTIHDFRSVDGSEGKFVQKLKIYAQKQCPVCGTAVAKVTLGGRTSWYCPSCQA